MTDNDIMKTLEAIASEAIGDCKRDCAFYDGRVHYCAGVISRNALDLIGRYKAEIADLQDVIRCEKETNEHLCDEWSALSRECDRQKAEIERLQSKVEKLGKKQYDLYSQIVNLKDDVKYSKSEAIKEFAERMKDIVDEPALIRGRVIDSMMAKIDKLVKEMTEENSNG
ncbi:MAG: hypothetical protein IJF49_08385 [Clostridia bacterium]|nr:hypothetical protein [Clostridia bacterium]